MAGKGTRMAKYYEGPKQLLPVDDKPVVEHSLDLLPDTITEFIFVVGGPHEDTIRDHFKSGEYKGKPITFVNQEEQLGLAHAFRCAKDHVKDGSWLGMVGDDIFGPKGLAELVQHEVAVLAYRVPNPENFGVLVADDDGYLTKAVEKPQEFVSDLVWTGAMVMDQSFLELETQPSARGEYETPDVWVEMIKHGARIKVVEAEFWLPINDKDQLEEAQKVLHNQK